MNIERLSGVALAKTDPTLNVERRMEKANIQYPTFNDYFCFFIFFHSIFDVGRSMFDVHFSHLPGKKQLSAYRAKGAKEQERHFHLQSSVFSLPPSIRGRGAGAANCNSPGAKHQQSPVPDPDSPEGVEN